MTRRMASTEEGAQTPVYCATDPGLAGCDGPVLRQLPRA